MKLQAQIHRIRRESHSLHILLPVLVMLLMIPVLSGIPVYGTTQGSIASAVHTDSEEDAVYTGVSEEAADTDASEDKAGASSSTGWKTSGGYKYYYYKSNKYYKNTIATIKNKKYYFDGNGHLIMGYFKYKGNPYYSDTSTGVVKTSAGFITWNGDRYYVQKGGKIFWGYTLKLDGKRYKTFSTGRIGTGVFKYGKYYFYANDKGEVQTSAGFVSWNGNRYYVQKNSRIFRNHTLKLNGKKYKAFKDGHLGTGVFKYSGAYYYADSKGVVKTSKGFITWNKNRYYVQSSGKIFCGKTLKVSGKTYKAFSDGRLGTGVFKYGSDYFYANSNGEVQTTKGWVTYNNKRYYVQSGGKLYKSTFATISGNKYYFGSDAVLQTGNYTVDGKAYVSTSEGRVVNQTKSYLKGIDVSVFQGTINWKKVKASGIQFAIIRCGYRGSRTGTLATDSKFMTNIKNATAAGVDVGVYFFTEAITEKEARAEADYAINLIKKSGCTVTYPVVIDTENISGARAATGKLSKSKRTAIIKAFCDEVKKKGYTPMIYASTSWLNNQLDMSKLSGYEVWVAQYYTKVTYGGTYRCWQYTSSGKVNGISGRVDMDYWYY